MPPKSFYGSASSLKQAESGFKSLRAQGALRHFKDPDEVVQELDIPGYVREPRTRILLRDSSDKLPAINK